MFPSRLTVDTNKQDQFKHHTHYITITSSLPLVTTVHVKSFKEGKFCGYLSKKI